MRWFLLLASLLVAGTVRGQTDGEWETVVGDDLICGLGVDFDMGEIFRKGLEIAFAPRLFRKSWPLYGYAISNSQAGESCDLLEEKYPDIPIGKAAIVLQETSRDVSDLDSLGAASGRVSFDYIGFPVESVVVVESGATAARAGNSAVQSSPEHAEFRIREFCRWLREPSLFTQPMLRIDALPYDLPEGVWDNVEFDGNAPSFEPLMQGVIGDPDGDGTVPILTWRDKTAGADRGIVWTLMSGDEDLPAGPTFEEGGRWWRYTPADGSESRGDYYLSWKGSESGVMGVTFEDTTNWSSPSGDMEWNQMPVGEGAARSRFTMWYAPRRNPGNHGTAAALTDEEVLTHQGWYLLTEEPLPLIAPDVRVEDHCSTHTR